MYGRLDVERLGGLRQGWIGVRYRQIRIAVSWFPL
jgi:hypothetical protein